VREHAIGLDRVRDERVAVAADVDRHRAVPGGRERRELVTPRPRTLREAVDEQYQWPGALDHGVDVPARHVDLHAI
jgi:hypothetical protein